MMQWTRRLGLMALPALWLACSSPSPSAIPDAAADADTPDAEMDSAAPDAAPEDPAQQDAAQNDAGTADAETLHDASEPDAMTDAGTDAAHASACEAGFNCDDGLFCNGMETCQPASPEADLHGCAAGVSIVCDDHTDCTFDACNEAADTCRQSLNEVVDEQGVHCVEGPGPLAIALPTAGSGVPGNAGVPDWWSRSSAFDDPRWLGAYGYGHRATRFSAMLDPFEDKRTLLLRWHVTADPGIAGVGDQLFVGLYNPATTVGTILKLTRDANVTTIGAAPGPDVMTLTAVTRTGTSGLWGVTPVPTQVLAEARIDVACNGAFPAICDEWAIRLRIPITAAGGGIELGDVFKLWFELDVENAGAIERSKLPAGAHTADDTAFPTAFPEPLGSASPASPPWNDIRVNATGPCPPTVVIPAGSDLTVSNGLGAGTEIDLDSANTFHVAVRNDTAFTFNPDSIQARLRIADWLSNACGSATWAELPGATCDVATGSGAPGSVTPGSYFGLACTWTLTAGQRCAYRPDLYPGCTPDSGPRHFVQAIMAELSSSGTAIHFARDSEWNSFHFGPRL